MKRYLYRYFIMSLGILIIAVAVYFFKITNGFTTGGVSGIGTVIGKVTGIKPSVLIVIINVFLLLMGFIILGRKTGLNTVFCATLFSFLIWLFELIFPMTKPITDQPFLELTIAVLMTSFGSALIFNIDATTGGTDILAMILRKYTSLDVGKALLFVDFFVVLSTFWVFSVKIGLFSLLGLFVKGFLVDGIIENLNSCKYFMIITDEKEKIENYILNELERGVTVSKAEGGYTKSGKTIIHTVCRRTQAVRLKHFVKEVDPNAFVVVTTSHEIIGRGFRSL